MPPTTSKVPQSVSWKNSPFASPARFTLQLRSRETPMWVSGPLESIEPVTSRVETAEDPADGVALAVSAVSFAAMGPGLPGSFGGGVVDALAGPTSASVLTGPDALGACRAAAGNADGRMVAAARTSGDIVSTA